MEKTTFFKQYLKDKETDPNWDFLDALTSIYDMADHYFELGQEPFQNWVKEVCGDFADYENAHPSELKTLEIISRYLRQDPIAGENVRRLVNRYYKITNIDKSI